jgi:hypothetical protein
MLYKFDFNKNTVSWGKTHGNVEYDIGESRLTELVHFETASVNQMRLH